MSRTCFSGGLNKAPQSGHSQILTKNWDTNFFVNLPNPRLNRCGIDPALLLGSRCANSNWCQGDISFLQYGQFKMFHLFLAKILVKYLSVFLLKNLSALQGAMNPKGVKNRGYNPFVSFMTRGWEGVRDWRGRVKTARGRDGWNRATLAKQPIGVKNRNQQRATRKDCKAP